MKTTILILAANPKGTAPLELMEEIRDIDEVLKRSKNRDLFEVQSKLAVRAEDLQNALLETKPRIVHFSGHGTGNEGLVLQNNAGKAHLVSTETLANLFGLVANSVECVLFNACYSEVQAKAIVEKINYVIGMRQSIRDDAAIAFTTGFYGALGGGESIESAYSFGCNRIQLEISRSSVVGVDKAATVPEYLIPVLLKKEVLTPMKKVEATPQPNANNTFDIKDSNITNLTGSGSIITGDNFMNSNDYSRKIEIGSVGRDISGQALNLGEMNISGTVTNTIGQLEKSDAPEALKLAELLKQLQTAIEANPDLSEDDKAEALEQVKVLAEAGKKPQEGGLQKAAKTAIKVLKGTITSLPAAAKLVEYCNEMFPTIVRLLGLA
ncbi:CHAT domain-containing protein [Argonema antarcticum]|uniref:CHAT domain-containing protein n=1 Tax=Argonema antarcticum TaxID=2942763 RepID=UPI002013A9A6|nr:CHAT domain-containing protein [Argonema antarcticum]MCL1469207.1 CHAT domain-containing protein [Argonema antarcticum A004/B2]